MGLWTSRPGKRLLLIVLLSMLCATGGCRQSPWTLWNSYSARFIDAQGRVFDPQGDQHTTSEGQAYALFFALAGNDRAPFRPRAGLDPEQTWPMAIFRPTFRPGCGARTRTASGRRWIANPASDADVWMAYTLIEAGPPVEDIPLYAIWAGGCWR